MYNALYTLPMPRVPSLAQLLIGQRNRSYLKGTKGTIINAFSHPNFKDLDRAYKTLINIMKPNLSLKR